jgi:hypothetical protein
MFEITEAEETAVDEATRELPSVAPGSDEEDTLHPEDNVQPPPPAPSAVDTMVVPTDEIRAAVAAADEEKVHVPLARKLLAVLVIIALVALIVVLVLWGLAR